MFLGLDKKKSDNIAIIDDMGIQVSYGGIIDAASQVDVLKNGKKLVFVLNNNSVSSAVAYLICMLNGAVPLMLGYAIDDLLLKNLIDIYEPEYIWKPADLCSEDEIAKSKWGTYCLIETGYKSCALNDNLSLLLTTSGSTGSPKLVRHTYNNLESQGKNISAFFDLSENDVPMIDLPINYTFGLSVLNSHLYAGATCLITNLNVLDPKYWQFFKTYNATSITGVPYTFEILKKIRFFRMNLPSLKLITQGGGKLSDVLFEELAQYAENTGRKFVATYGQTEGSARMAYLPADKATTKICSIGYAIPNGKLYLIDDDGKEIETVEAEGEMVYEGPNVTMGYAEKKEDLTKGDERHGILFTGDIARRDADGCFYIVGRKKRFLKLNGYRIGLDESERIIRDKFDVECACTGDDDKMIIYVTSDIDKDELRAYISKKCGLNATFFRVEFIEKLPRNEAGKILYSKL